MTTVASETADPSRSYRQPIDDVIAALGTNVRHGLSDSEAQSRLQQHGRNELVTEKPLPAWRRFLAQFQDVLVILLLVATAISAGLWAYERLFTNHWLWTALGVSLLLQVVVLYTPFLQRAFGTVSLSAQDWVFCAAIASSVLWLREISKLVARALRKA